MERAMKVDSMNVLGIRVPDPHLEGVTFSLLRLDGPFCFGSSIAPTLNFYFVRRGKVLFECAGKLNRRVVLTANACIGVSGRIAHSFKCTDAKPDRSSPTIRKEALSTPDHGESVELVWGCVPEESILYVRAFQDVPIIFPDSAPGIADNIRRAIDWIERESVRDDPSSKAIIRRMAEIINMEIGRFSSLEKPELALSMHAANTDKRILRALTAIYREPERQWTLQSLAEEAGMSRTAFAARYRDLMGTTPLQGLQRLRLRRAAEQLMNDPSLSVDMVAENGGYQSSAVFIRAFNREFGMSPGRWRHAAVNE